MEGYVFFAIVLGLALYFTPTIIAVSRHHHNAGMIAVLNIFLGWTFLGWVISFAMALSQTQRERLDVEAALHRPRRED